VTVLGIALPIDPCQSRWTSGRQARLPRLKYSVSVGDPGGDFGISKDWFGPCSKNLAETVFETKYLIYFIFSTARVIWSDRADPVPARRLAGQIWPPPRSRLVLVKLSGDDDQAERARLRAT
jgi:hypothetical protein